MKKLLFIILFISACSTNQNDKKIISNFNFSDDLTFEDFKSKLKVYSGSNPYPNIDN